jgi:hypothetical protein
MLHAQIFVHFTPAREILVAVKRLAPTKQVTPANIWPFLNDPWLSVIIWPPIGEPVKAAMDENANMVPVRTPMSLIGETWAQSAGVRPIPAPDPIPNRTAKIMIGAFPEVGSHKARIKAAVKKLMTIMTLNLPTLSAITLGTVRPKMLPSSVAGSHIPE